MKRLIPAAVIAIVLTLAAPLRAQEFTWHQSDDHIVLDLSAEDWVTTKTARVTVSIESAVSATNEGSMRADMFKAVNEVAKADWRLTSFDRSQDDAGLERWSTSFEARVPENELNGLADTAKKLSKAGMQLTIGGIDFSPTLEETEAARNALRTQIYKQANDQLAAANAAFPGRNFRIANINFMSRGFAGPRPPMPRPMMAARAGAASSAMVAAGPMESADGSAERSEKITLTANVTLAAASGTTPDAKH